MSSGASQARDVEHVNDDSGNLHLSYAVLGEISNSLLIGQTSLIASAFTRSAYTMLAKEL